MSKKSRRQKADQLGTLLKHTHSELFDPETPVPLAIGIHDEIHAAYPEASRNVIRCFLRWWTSQKGYRNSIANVCRVRFHLDGSAAGDVSREHQEFAAEQLGQKVSQPA